MKNIFYLMIGMFLIATSCEDAGTDILFDDQYLELDAATTVTGSKGYTYLRVNDGQGVPSGFMVNLGARQQSSPINFTFSIDASSTAIEGIHYSVSGNTGTVEANSSLGELPITIMDDNIEPGEVFTIVVTLESGDIPINPEYNNGTHNIQITCESNLAGTYTSTTTGTSTDGCCPGEVTVNDMVRLTETEPGTYLLSDFSAGLYLEWYDVYGITPDFVQGGGLNGAVVDICGAISGEFGEPFGTAVNVTGSVDPDSGVITYSWVNGFGDQATVVLTPQ